MSQALAHDQQEQQEQQGTVAPADTADATAPRPSPRRRFRKMPLWARYGAVTILLIAAIFGVYAAVPAQSARLQLICQHSFRSGQIAVKVDGSQVYSSNLNVTSKKRLGILPKGASGPETFSRVIDVPTGKHVVLVRITAPAEGFDQARSAAADFAPDKESILTINAVRRSSLAVNLEGAAVVKAANESESHPLPRNGITVLFSVLGTMLSASISFLVQEFWRSHKNRTTP